MKNLSLLLLACCLVLCSSIALAQSYKFDFGSGAAANGYIKITPESIFNKQAGYGFAKGTALQAVRRKAGKDILNDFITADKPFFFSVQLPEGNYDVKILLGDAEATSATTVRAENRRLFLPNIRTEKGKFITKTFTVHIRDSLIRDAGNNITDKVKLKPREVNYLHWDDLLTLEFNDSLVKVCAIEISPNKKATTVFLAGNSTVVDQDKEPWAAWGQIFPSFF